MVAHFLGTKVSIDICSSKKARRFLTADKLDVSISNSYINMWIHLEEVRGTQQQELCFTVTELQPVIFHPGFNSRQTTVQIYYIRATFNITW